MARQYLQFKAGTTVTKGVGGISTDEARRTILAAMRKVLECRLAAIIAKRKATGRANVENSNTIREGVLWRTKLRRLLRRHQVMRQTHLCLQLSVLLACHQTKAIGYWTADAVTTLLAHENASLRIRRFHKETTSSESPTTPRLTLLDEAMLPLTCGTLVRDAGRRSSFMTFSMFRTVVRIVCSPSRSYEGRTCLSTSTAMEAHHWEEKGRRALKLKQWRLMVSTF